MLNDRPDKTMLVFVEGDLFTFTRPKQGEPAGRIITNPHELRKTRASFYPPMRISDLFSDGFYEDPGHGSASHVSDILRLNIDHIPPDYLSHPENRWQREPLHALYTKTYGTQDGFEEWLRLADAPGMGHRTGCDWIRSKLAAPNEQALQENSRMEKEFDETVCSLPFFVKLLAHAYVPQVFLCKTKNADHLNALFNAQLGVFFYDGNHRKPEVVTEEIMHFVDSHILFYRRMDEINQPGTLDFIGEDSTADCFSRQPTFMAAIDADIAALRTNQAARRLIQNAEKQSHKEDRGNMFSHLSRTREDRYFEAFVDFINIYAMEQNQVHAAHKHKLASDEDLEAQKIMRNAFPHMSMCFFESPPGMAVGRDASGCPVMTASDKCAPAERFTPFMDLLKFRILYNEDIDIPRRHTNDDDSEHSLAYINDNRGYLREALDRETPRPSRRERFPSR